jgi:hypothetical protein
VSGFLSPQKRQAGESVGVHAGLAPAAMLSTSGPGVQLLQDQHGLEPTWNAGEQAYYPNMPSTSPLQPYHPSFLLWPALAGSSGLSFLPGSLPGWITY